jgi:HNH endonuclease/AP2 domain
VSEDFALIPVRKRSGIVAYAKCDKEHAEELLKFKWHLSDGGYAVRTAKKISMHRTVMKHTGKLDIDHINRDKLDNRSENLRVVSRNANSQNSKASGKSKYLGVYLKKSSGKWGTQIGFNWKRFYGGYFLTEQEAAKRYNEMALELFGPDARLNEV